MGQAGAENPGITYTEYRGLETGFSGVFQNQQENQRGWSRVSERVVENEVKVKGCLLDCCAMLRTLALTLRRASTEDF